VFTNLTRDHLDMHGSPEAYLAAKSQLFMHLPAGGIAVLNADDPASALIDEIIPQAVRRLRYATGAAAADLASNAIEVSRAGTCVHLCDGPVSRSFGGKLELGVIGEVHGQNAMAAALACLALGYQPAAIARGLRDFSGVCGRFEVVGREPLVIVDYAHSPDGLTQTLRTARRLVQGKGELVCVFGCGGQRDKGKRPMMGQAADELADRVVLTSDNPRNEAPEAIAADVRAGARGLAGWVEELRRPAAIERAVREAQRDDVIVIAGKGHETVQEIMGQKIDMADQHLARAALSNSP
jgi:UDP-N-acetylmuramoyl-L-alanyl-D-glutamate--2,6-diaminopimelate ligase